MKPFDPQELKRRKRLIHVALMISVVIQGIIIGIYYFKEKQVTLVMPMLLGLFITFYAIIQVGQIDR